MRLIALAHGLEVAGGGGAHLRELPEQPKVQKKKVHDAKLVSTGGGRRARVRGLCNTSWRLSTAAAAAVVADCRCRPHRPVPQLPGWGVEGGDWAEIDRLNEEELAAAQAALLGGGGADDNAGASRIASQVQQLSLADAEAAAATLRGDASTSGGDSDAEEEDDHGEWETAAKSAGSQRRQRRKAARKAAWEARQAAAATAGAGEGGALEPGNEGEGEEEPSEGEEDACSLASDDDATAATAAPATGDAQPPGSAAQQQLPESGVAIITADFAMQNVIMQVGPHPAQRASGVQPCTGVPTGRRLLVLTPAAAAARRWACAW